MKVSYPLALIVATIAVIGSSSTTSRASETDDRIETSFHNTFVYKTYLKDEHITIKSKDGHVWLSGTVGNESHKPMAADTAEALPGVKGVENRIEITGKHPMEKSDAWITTKVKSALLYRRNVSGTKTEVTTTGGVVTLKGEAANQAQKDLTSEYAKDIEGVTTVKNEMTIAATPEKPQETVGEKIDDASITAQVKATLLSHRSTSVLSTKVTTTDGVVTVGGKAKNAAEKALVTKLVTDINGVSSVVNNMTIEQTMSQNK